jgi:hypothetical protein
VIPHGPRKREEVLRGLTAPARSEAAAGLVARLARGRELRKRLRWPGAQLEVDLQVLTRAETAQAHADAIAACAKRGIDDSSLAPRSIEARADEEMVQILSRAVLDVETGKPLCTSAEELAGVATDDELVALFNAYADHRHAVDPDIGDMPAEELALLDEAIKKKDETLLSRLVSSMPRPWLRSLVVRLATSPTPSSGSSSPPIDEQPQA